MKKIASLVLCIAVSLVTAIAMSACSVSKMGLGNTDPVDFNASLELKKPQPAAGDTPKILFVGNSHTFSNDLPGMFYQLSLSLGNESDIYDLTEGYYTLEQFADPEDELGAILDEALTGEKWDFVVLQENTGKSVSPTAEKDMFPYARTLDEKIKAAGGQTAFLMTWSPKSGIDSGLLKMSRDEVQSMIANHYSAISNELDSLLIPAGTAFMRCSSQYPDIELWDEDGQHPSPAGTYLTACTSYAVFFQKSPDGGDYPTELDAGTASRLQGVAAGFLQI